MLAESHGLTVGRIDILAGGPRGESEPRLRRISGASDRTTVQLTPGEGSSPLTPE